MKALRSVLFVDDEPRVLAGLRRSMRALREEWQSEFAASGPEALEKMSGSAFDVVVSDMMMPGMNGAELLHEVRERFPSIVRIVLSGQANPALVAQCMHVAHRFLHKPCELDVLRRTMESTTSIATALSDPGLRALVGKIRRLPSPNRMCRELEERLRSEQVSLEEIGALVARDMGMTAQVLKVVNSAYFGLASKLETAQEAVAYLGLELIHSLAVFTSLTEQVQSMGMAEDVIEGLWRHSLRVSAAARYLAELEHLPKAVVKECTTAGLLHDTGKLILALNFPNRCERVDEDARVRKLDITTVEREQIGCSHAEVGGYLFALWGLSLPVVQGVAWHHSPGQQSSTDVEPSLIVHVADVLTHEFFNESEGGMVPQLDEAALDGAGLTSRMPRLRKALENRWRSG